MGFFQEHFSRKGGLRYGFPPMLFTAYIAAISCILGVHLSQIFYFPPMFSLKGTIKYFLSVALPFFLPCYRKRSQRNDNKALRNWNVTLFRIFYSLLASKPRRRTTVFLFVVLSFCSLGSLCEVPLLIKKKLIFELVFS